MRILDNGEEIGQALAQGNEVIVRTNGIVGLSDGVHAFSASQEFGSVVSAGSDALDVTIDTSPTDFTSSPPLFAQVAEAYAYDVNSTDEGSGVIYRLADAPAGMTIDENTGQVNWVPQDPQVGTNDVIVEATDAPGNTARQTFSVFVNERNEPPMLLDVEDQLVAENGTLTFTVQATDPNLPNDSLSFGFADSPSGMTIDPTSGQIVWTPGELDGPTVSLVTVEVTDGLGETDTGTFQVEVTEVNQPPSLDAILGGALFEIEAEDDLLFTATASDPDVPVNRLTFELASDAPPGATIDPDTGQFRWNTSVDHALQDFTFTVRVRDEGGLTDEREVMVRVLERSEPPHIHPVTPQTVAEGSTLAVRLEAEDPNTNEQLTFSLGAGAPATATIDPATGQFVWTPNEDDGPGSYEVPVRVTDSTGLSETTTLFVDVTEVNQPPTIAAIADQEAFERIAFRHAARASDTDRPRQGLRFSLDQGPEGLAIDPVTGELTWTPPVGSEGNYTVTIRVTDTGNPALSATESFNLTVTDILGAVANDLTIRSQVNDAVLADFSMNEPLLGDTGFTPTNVVPRGLVSPFERTEQPRYKAQDNQIYRIGSPSTWIPEEEDEEEDEDLETQEQDPGNPTNDPSAGQPVRKPSRVARKDRQEGEEDVFLEIAMIPPEVGSQEVAPAEATDAPKSETDASE